MRNITMEFPGIRALDNVSFDLRAGEVHVLLGENGAGKSTLINIMAGALRPTHGTMAIDGHPVVFKSPKQARHFGISAVYQEFSLIGSMTVAENLFLGVERTRFSLLSSTGMRAVAQQLLDEFGFDIRESEVVDRLPRGRQQMVEILKALMTNPRVLIFDEPTASLTEAESEHLFEFIGKLRERKVGMVYISHRMKEIRKLADRVTVMRDGRHIATVANSDASDDELISLMSGRPASEIYPTKQSSAGATRLAISNLTLKSGRARNVSISLSQGEVVGIAGLVGCGKSEVGRALFGLEAIEAGSIALEGSDFTPASPRAALNAGICYFPSDRAAEGLALGRPVVENASMSSVGFKAFSRFGVLRKDSERKRIGAILSDINLKPLDLNRLAGSFSGGNKQKVVLARGLARDVSLFVFDEPTVGIDVTAKTEIYGIIRRLAERGASVLLISSELPEIIGMSDRVYVMNKGRVAGELRSDQISEEAILAHFFSH